MLSETSWIAIFILLIQWEVSLTIPHTSNLSLIIILLIDHDIKFTKEYINVETINQFVQFFWPLFTMINRENSCRKALKENNKWCLHVAVDSINTVRMSKGLVEPTHLITSWIFVVAGFSEPAFKNSSLFWFTYFVFKIIIFVYEKCRSNENKNIKDYLVTDMWMQMPWIWQLIFLPYIYQHLTWQSVFSSNLPPIFTSLWCFRSACFILAQYFSIGRSWPP